MSNNKEKTFKKVRLGIPWRLIVTALIVMAQVIITIWAIGMAENQYLWLRFVFSILWIILFVIIINRNEPASYKLPWVTVILVFPIAGAVLFAIFSKPKLSKKAQKRFNSVNPKRSKFLVHDEETLKKLKCENKAGVGISNYIYNTAKTPLYQNTEATFISSGESFFKQLFEDIKNAKQFVFLEYFIIREGEIWQTLYEILLEKVKQGVSIFIIYDDFGCIRYLPFDFDAKLRKQGINCYKFNPFYPIVSIVHNNRDHRKIAVIDGQIGYTGGINIGDEYANIEQPFGKWKDCAVKLVGDAVDGLSVMFIENYNSVCEKPLNASDYLRPHQKIESNGFVQPFGDGPRPVDQDYISQSLYLNLMYSAKEYLYIATPYFIVDTSFFDALDSCVKRGVNVVLLTPHIPDKKAVFAITRSAYERLITSGVKVYEYGDGFIHSKTVVCDGKIAVIGTVNFDYRSFIHHYECGALLFNSDCIKQIENDFLQTIENCGVKQTLKTAKLSFFEKTIKNFIGMFAPLL